MIILPCCTGMKAMKAMKASSSKAMTKGALTAAIAEEHELKQKVCREVLDSFVAIAAAEVKKNGIFNVPNLFRIKTRVKPATKAGTRMMFGKEVKVAARPANDQLETPTGLPMTCHRNRTRPTR